MFRNQYLNLNTSTIRESSVRMTSQQINGSNRPKRDDQENVPFTYRFKQIHRHTVVHIVRQISTVIIAIAKKKIRIVS